MRQQFRVTVLIYAYMLGTVFRGTDVLPGFCETRRRVLQAEGMEIFSLQASPI